MSSLWMNQNKKKLLTMQKRPSPKHDQIKQSLARGSQFFILKKTPLLKRTEDSIKGISLFTAFPYAASTIDHPITVNASIASIKASITVEASILLPLFLFFFLQISSAIEMIRLHGNMQLALWNVGNKLTAMESVLGETKLSVGAGEFGDLAIGYFYVRSELENYLGREYLASAPVQGGADGFSFWESDIFTQEDCAKIIVTYKVSAPNLLSESLSFRMANCYYCHLWNGYSLEQEKEQAEIVYITEYGEVFHTNRACSHLELSVSQTTKDFVVKLRNEKGEKYKPCEKCGGAMAEELLFITKEGNRYHCDGNCSGLKRLVKAIQKEHASGYRPCSRCASEK